MGRARRIVASTPHALAISDYVRVGLVATLVAGFALRAGRLHDLAVSTPPIDPGSSRIAMSWHKRTSRFAPIEWLREQIRSIVKHSITDSGTL